MFITATLLQALTREGFDIVRHPASSLSLGELGWIQITNFVVSGFLVVAFSIGARRLMRNKPGGTFAPALLGIFGAALVVGGVFIPDKGLGFPPGAPKGNILPMRRPMS
ncbi:MAG: DUF998 domain-containing protein [Terriglobia bacterium]